MTDLTPAKRGSTLSRNATLSLLVVGALLCMGAKWAEEPIESLASIAGAWHGSGANKRGKTFNIKFTFKEDGSFKFSQVATHGKGSKDGERPPGTLRVLGGKLEYNNLKDTHLWTVTLYKNKKGKRMLKARRDDGNNWQVTEKK